jgi:purine catabolism regulator
VRTVTDLPGLGLRHLAGPDGRDRPVRWVAVSELEDPTAFLEGGELLLSTGMRLPADRPDQLALYVDRLVGTGVAAFGLGVGLTHPVCPPGLVDAADAAGLPLVEVPARTAFIAVSKAVSALLGVEEYDAITRAFDAQRDLTRAALAPQSAAAVITRLVRHVGGWALVLDPAGSVLHAAGRPVAGDGAAARAAALGPELAALRHQGLLSSSSLGDADGQVSLHPLGASGRVRGFLAVGTAAPLDRNAQSVVAVAVSLLSLAAEQGPAGPGPAVVRVATVRLLLAGADPADLPLELLGWGRLAGGPLRVVVVGGTAAQRAGVAHGLDPLAADRPAAGVDDVASADLGEELVVLLPDEPALVDQVTARVAGVPAGGSVADGVAGLPPAVREARQALASARGTGLAWYGQLAAAGMLAALDPEVARGLARTLLAPLAGRKGDLVDSLAAWLGRHGQWDTAAADLGVHRHTLRYRMRRVEELLGRSLDDPDLRAELWLALRIRAQDVVGWDEGEH